MADDFLITEMDISKLKVPDLKKELKLRGLSTTGNKIDLIERLQNALKSSDNGGAESVDDLDDDLLNDDELDHDHLDTSESVLNELDHLEEAQESSSVMKRKLSKTDMPDLDSKLAKKIVLNRSSSAQSNSEKTNGTDPLLDSAVNEYSAKSDEDGKVVKLSELSAKERLEMRAKKFGTPTSAEAKKVARAERFSGTISVESSPVLEANLETLKRRAERFGGSVSKALSSVEQQERLKKRKERFGIVTTSNAASQNGKAQQRLERFKTPVT
ncbi:hypothetical protein PPYR_10779 [Photinus pyralis]|uniref:SAP domain-containing protein n=1 Tax=Photinus pyralis TaxID=7054 RepID=A0A1Y1LNI4_PHOPY|nr:SAP domain-containing ribonucleoprotein [Photinus pyralis]KAB0796718.1 hypothetical protein PPYR_10779 [Photinus pyralis]